MRNENASLSKERPMPRRKIEQAMVEAIRQGAAFHSDNTMVGAPNGLGWQTVHLHGNLIGASRIGMGGMMETQIEKATFRRWPTRTTVSRLRALGVPASVRNGIAMIGDHPA